MSSWHPSHGGRIVARACPSGAGVKALEAASDLPRGEFIEAIRNQINGLTFQTLQLPCRFLDAYGRPNRQALPERSNQPNLAQALHMLAGSTYTDKIARNGGRVDRLVEGGVSNRQAVEELYLAALCRLPTERERAELNALIRRQPTRREALESLAWALISAREFAYNH